MTADEIVKQLEPLGTTAYKSVLQKHGIPDPFFGVKIEYLKKFQKRIKKDYQLALELYETGIYDARYLAGLIADESRMTRKDIQRWMKTANCGALAEYTVPWVASETNFGHELALEWIESKDENVAVAGWKTLSCMVAITDDKDLDIVELKQLLERVRTTIHEQPNLVRYVMNNFVISVGIYVQALTKPALQTAAKIGIVTVDMHGTACKVPSAPVYIRKAQDRGTIGRKRKTNRC